MTHCHSYTTGRHRVPHAHQSLLRAPPRSLRELYSLVRIGSMAPTHIIDTCPPCCLEHHLYRRQRSAQSSFLQRRYCELLAELHWIRHLPLSQHHCPESLPFSFAVSISTAFDLSIAVDDLLLRGFQHQSFVLQHLCHSSSSSGSSS